MPTISVAMIVKNEEHELAQCLDSVKDWVDEIIILDSGSTVRNFINIPIGKVLVANAKLHNNM